MNSVTEQLSAQREVIERHRHQQNGIFDGISMSEYLSITALSSGVVNVLLNESPMHARHAYDNPDNESRNEADMGTAIHSALLEGIDLVVPLDFPDWRTKAAREARDTERLRGNIPLLAHKAQNVLDAVQAVKDQLPYTELYKVFEMGKPEQVVKWNDHGIRCKARPDWLSERWHISLKTTDGSARPDAWIRRQLGPMGYDTALAFYERGLRAIGWRGQSRLLVAEQNPPYRIVVVALAPSRQQYAEARAERAIRVWSQCVASGKWPGYSTQTHFAELLPYEEAAEFELSQPFTEDDMKAGIPL